MYTVVLLCMVLMTCAGCQNPSLPFEEEEVYVPKVQMVEDRSDCPLTENWESKYSP